MRDVKKVSWPDFEAMFHEDVKEAIRNARNKSGIKGVVALRCEVFDSSRFGQLTALTYGAPDSTFQSVQSMADRQGGIYVTGLPSSAAFPVAYTEEMPS